MFLMNTKRGVKSSDGEQTIYHLHDMSYNKMKNYILHLPTELIIGIQKIMDNFPENFNIHEQCAYYMRAFSRSQIFLDGNHRTGYFSLVNILKKKGIIIDSDTYEITSLTEYIKGQGWMEQGNTTVNLKEKDDEYYFLADWFEKRLKFR